MATLIILEFISYDCPEYCDRGQNSQPNYRVLLDSPSAGLIVIAVLSILDIKDWLTFKIFLIPCPFFVAYIYLHLVSLECVS